MLFVRIRADQVDIMIIQVHTSTSDQLEEEMDVKWWKWMCELE